MNVEFSYEITKQDYAAANLLFSRLSGHREKAMWSLFFGVLLTALPFFQDSPKVLFALGSLIGLWFLFRGIRGIFPNIGLGRYYQVQQLENEPYKAVVTQDGINVEGSLQGWKVKWPALTLRGENDKLFLLYCYPTVFIFGKRFLSNDQQGELRKLAGLRDPSVSG